MFNIGPLEIITVLIIALIVVGPKRLPELARTIGRGLNEFRKLQDEVKDMVKFDLGTDLLGDTDTSAPSYDRTEPGPEAVDTPDLPDDGMTHSERVIAALPDERGPMPGEGEGVAPLPVVASSSLGETGPATADEDADTADPDEPPAEEPPAAAAE